MVFRNLVLSITIPVVGGYISGLKNKSAIETWYKKIDKPWFTPPNFVFPVVWTTIYISMGYASYLVGQEAVSYQPVTSFNSLAQYSTQPYFALFYYCLQLAFNFAWSPLFFWYMKFKLAFFDSLTLNILLIPTAVSFWKCNKTAGAIIAAYFSWVSIASTLNYIIWKRNPSREVKF